MSEQPQEPQQETFLLDLGVVAVDDDQEGSA